MDRRQNGSSKSGAVREPKEAHVQRGQYRAGVTTSQFVIVGMIIARKHGEGINKTDPDTEVNCIAVRVSIADGVITSERGIAVESKKFNAVASGTINLGAETLALGVTPTMNQGFSLGTDQVAKNLRIGGTLANPDIGLDVAGTARSAAALAADVATSGGWLLVDALLRRSKADPNPCATALGEAR